MRASSAMIPVFLGIAHQGCGPWWSARRMCHEHEGRRLRHGLGERVVQYESIGPAATLRYIVPPHRHLVGLAFARPLHTFQSNALQLFDHIGRLMFRDTAALPRTIMSFDSGCNRCVCFRVKDSRCRQIWRDASLCAWMFEYAKVQALLIGLQTPGDSVTGGDIDPADDVALQELDISCLSS